MFNLEYNIKRLNIICQVLFTTNFAHKKRRSCDRLQTLKKIINKSTNQKISAFRFSLESRSIEI
jgi:hypothetical protein